MGLLGALPIIGPIIEKVVDVVDQAVPDKDLANKLKSELQTKLMTLDSSVLQKEIDAKAKILVAEAGGNWLQRSWRPITMLVFVFIIFNYYVFIPYLETFGANIPDFTIPNGLWALLTTGLGGYVVGRSGEKMVKTWKTR
ncbi:MAG: hypothetical protein HQ562_10500 [Candidatus Marinimicrobia bacterium]|nr:hypothetical protein [Candidatus Neomarinimicrobiota bacterium]